MTARWGRAVRAGRPLALLAMCVSGAAISAESWAAESGAAGPAVPGGTAAASTALPGLSAGQPITVETMIFQGGSAPVRLMRGVPPPPAGPEMHAPGTGPVKPSGAGPASAAAPSKADSARQKPTGPEQAAAPVVAGVTHVEVLRFGPDRGQRVTVVRGAATPGRLPAPAQTAASPAGPARSELVRFADPRLPPVTVVRGAMLRELAAGLFDDDAGGGELDRIAFAVDGVESRHGADLRMWRDNPAGPQGPMQVSLAAALDVGGGNRFDLRENRLLGRAYLAQMFRRYGNWRDALAAYNWGPGNLDQWIAAGRPAERLPIGVTQYVARVLRDALVGSTRL